MTGNPPGTVIVHKVAEFSNNPRRVTLRDVAQSCGYSITAVSLALRGHRQIPEETREKIRAEAVKLGYRVNPLVSALMALRSRKSRSAGRIPLALLTDRLVGSGALKDEPNSVAIRRGIERQAEALGFYIEEFNPQKKEKTAAGRLQQILRNRSVPGLIVEQCSDIGWMDEFPFEHFCAVARGTSQGYQIFNSVTSDTYSGIGLVMEKLRALGYRRPALGVDVGTNRETRYGYESAYYGFCRHLFPEVKIPAHVRHAPEEALDEIQWFERYQPDVIIGKKIYHRELVAAGVKFPENAAFVCLDWQPEYLDWAGVDNRFERLGMDLVNLLVAQIHRNELGLPETPHLLLTRPSWVDGASCPRIQVA